VASDVHRQAIGDSGDLRVEWALEESDCPIASTPGSRGRRSPIAGSGIFDQVPIDEDGFIVVESAPNTGA
jgi:hypothetical protein